MSTKVTPLGSAPTLVSAGVGEPVVVTMNDPAEPTVNVVELALVVVGAVCEEVTVKVSAFDVRPVPAQYAVTA